MESIRNIAIIAHVDHGKTTLVDKIMYHCQLFRDNENAGNLDNNDLERERGITITSKNVSVVYKERKSTLLILLVTPISVVK
jgi:GTP-binding protein